jgi:hypothetical protein
MEGARQLVSESTEAYDLEKTDLGEKTNGGYSWKHSWWIRAEGSLTSTTLGKGGRRWWRKRLLPLSGRVWEASRPRRHNGWGPEGRWPWERGEDGWPCEDVILWLHRLWLHPPVKSEWLQTVFNRLFPDGWTRCDAIVIGEQWWYSEHYPMNSTPRQRTLLFTVAHISYRAEVRGFGSGRVLEHSFLFLVFYFCVLRTRARAPEDSRVC